MLNTGIAARLNALVYSQMEEGSELLEISAGLYGVFVRAEGCKTEETASVAAESLARCTDDAEPAQYQIKEFPAAHVAGTLEPDIRRVDSASEIYALGSEHLSKSRSVALVISDVCFAVFKTFSGK